jgi:hypothetical protein
MEAEESRREIDDDGGWALEQIDVLLMSEDECPDLPRILGRHCWPMLVWVSSRFDSVGTFDLSGSPNKPPDCGGRCLYPV